MSRHDEIIEKTGPEPIDLVMILQDFFRIVRRKWLFLLLTTVALAVGMMVWRYHSYVPYYEAGATYAITTYQNAASTYQDSNLTRQMAKTSPYILTSDMFRRRVNESLGQEMTSGYIQASVMEETNFLTISVTDTDPQRANETLQVVREVYPDVAQSIIGAFFMEPMDETGVPAEPVNPRNIKADLLEGGLLGFLISAAVIVAMAFTNGTVRREEDCIRRINTKCLCVVPHIRHKVRSSGAEQQLNILKKNASPELIEAFRSLRNKIERSSGKNGCKTLLVTSALPGEGKSTIAVNTALSLAQAGRRVALVDCDLRNPTDCAVLGAPEGPGLIDFLESKNEVTECLVSGQELFGYNLPFQFLRGGEAVKDGSAYLSTPTMKKLVEILEKQVDYLILDTPPSGLLTDAGILAQHAEGVLFVVKEDFAKVDKILEAMEHVSQGNAEMLGCVLNDDN